AYGDVAAAWHDYLAHYNQGHGFILIGHSQGSYLLRALIADEIDRDPALRKRLVSAILLGGAVLVKEGKAFGGEFRHVKGCKSPSDLRCVIGFSTFDAPVPSDARFGRAGSRIGQDGEAARYVVLCTNPASLRGGAGRLDPIFPSAP